MSRKFIPGSVVELLANANCIPAGKYQFEREEDEFLMFSVGSKISFGLSKNYYTPFIKEITASEQRKTSTDFFMSEYARLFGQLGTAVPGSTGMTFCAMHPSLQRKFWRLHRQSQKPSGLRMTH